MGVVQRSSIAQQQLASIELSLSGDINEMLTAMRQKWYFPLSLGHSGDT